jgi:hypothetical protein
MNDITPIRASLPSLVRIAAQKLASAENAAEVLDARDHASVAYDAAKSAGRLARAKQAHDEVISTVYRAQADALEIESMAKRRLADEYDAAQDRGEVRKAGNSSQAEELIAAADIGLSHKEIHEARQIRDAEEVDPGIVRRTLDRLISSGEEPTKAAVRREIAARPEPRVSDDALWLWGRLRDFDGKGYLTADIGRLLSNMTEPMRLDVCRLVPLVRNFLEDLEVSLEPA